MGELNWLAVFLGGLALNLTPCVYPMVPVTLAFFSSQSSGRGSQTLWLACCYVLGMSLSYAALGVFAAQSGRLLGSWLQQPLVLAGVAAVIVALALSMFGLYELRPPAAVLQRLGRASTGAGGAVLMGLVVGVVAAPCIGPFVLGLMLFVSQLANPVSGFLLFFVLGLGMGLPYLLLAVVARRVGTLPKAGRWLVWIKRALGVVLLGVAFYVAKPLLPASLASPAVARRPSVAWTPYSEVALAQARNDQRPVVIDIYADWCVPCMEMDRATFHHPDVVTALFRVVTLRVDATREVSGEAQALLERYHVFGVPTTLFFDSTGTERPELRLAGFEGPQEFLQRLQQLH